jgi:hypothetical protein
VTGTKHTARHNWRSLAWSIFVRGAERFGNHNGFAGRVQFVVLAKIWSCGGGLGVSGRDDRGGKPGGEHAPGSTIERVDR